jgi:hypothetical protein
MVYVPFWPGRFIPPMPTVVTDSQARAVGERGSSDTAAGAPARSDVEKQEATPTPAHATLR